MEGYWWETPGILSFRRQLYVCSVLPLNHIIYALASIHGSSMERIQRTRAKGHPIYAYPGDILEILSTILASFGTYYAGRRRWLIVSNLTVLFGLLLQASQINSTCDFVGYLIVKSGFHSVMVVGPVYMSEVSSVSLRAFMSGTHNFYRRFALVLIDLIPRTSPLLNLVSLVLIVVSVVISFMLPETPYWLAMNGKTEAAEEALEWLRGNQLDEAEADELLENAAAEAQRKQAGLVANLWSLEFGWRFTIIFCLYLSCFAASNLVNLNQYKWDRETRKYFYKKMGPNYTFYSLLIRINELAGAILFLILSFLLGRRILFIRPVILSYILILSEYVSSYSVRLAVYLQSFIYLSDNVGSIPIPPLITPEICSTVTRSFGFAVFRFLYIFLDYLIEYITFSPVFDEWYYLALFNIQLSLFPVGLVYLIFYMPETQNLSLTQAQMAAGSFQVLFESNVLGKSSK